MVNGDRDVFINMYLFGLSLSDNLITQTDKQIFYIKSYQLVIDKLVVAQGYEV